MPTRLTRRGGTTPPPWNIPGSRTDQAAGFTFSRTVVAVATIALIFAAILVFGLYLALSSSSTGYEQIESMATSDTVALYRNDFGIPHVIASSDNDAFVALGYLHAQDRLWQMDLYRRIACGQLAEIFGEEVVQTDAFFRSLGLGWYAQNVIYPRLSVESKRVLAAYTRGVNLFIEHHRRRLPFEFGALSYMPAPWKEWESIAIGRLMAFDLSMSFWTDIVLGEIADRHGIEIAMRLIPRDPGPHSPRVLQQSSWAAHAAPTEYRRLADASRAPVELFSVHRTNEVGTILRAVGSAYLSVREQTGFHSLGGGSNSWAVQIQDKTQPDAVLANDPHLALGLPARWYPVHLTAPGFNAIGMTLPGLPAMLSGRNDAIAWGVTNVMLDDCDYFIELLDTTRANTALFENGRIKINVRFDTIRVRSKSPVLIRIETIAGRPILSTVHPTARRDSIIAFPPLRSGTPLAQRYALSVAWTGYEPSDEIASMLAILKARSWTQFKAALKTWCAPALNFTYADVRGNIGIQPAGYVPVRDTGHPNLPRPGWIAAYRWRQVIPNPFPAIYNPPNRYVFSANNKTSDSLKFFVSNLWEPSSRAERINELLMLHRDYSVRDAQLEQLDLYSPYAQKIKSVVLPVLTTAPLDSLARAALQLFQEWNCYLHPNSAAAAAYSVFLERLMNIVFCSQLQQDEYNRYSFIASMPLRRITDILEMPTDWFAYDSSTAVRIRDRAIVQAWNEAVVVLQKQLGPVPHGWRWGQLHRLILEHPMATIPAYGSLLRREFNTIGGDATTIANGLWRLHKPYNVTIGASMRQVIRLRDTVMYCVVPGGVSGDPLSGHFADQLTLWANGGLIPLPTTPYPQPSWTLSTRLTPKSQ